MTESSENASFLRRPAFWLALAAAAWACFVLHHFLIEREDSDYLSIPVIFIDQFAPAHLWALAMAAACLFAGALTLRLCGYRSAHLLESILASFATGCVVMTVILLFVGPLKLHATRSLRLLTGGVALASLLSLAGWAWRRPRTSLTGNGALDGDAPPRHGFTNKACLGVLAIILWITWLSALMPPTRPDPLIEHLPRARAYANDGWGWPQPGGFYNARLMLAWAWSLGGPTARPHGGFNPTPEVVCALWVFLFGVASIAAVALVCRELGARARWPVAAILLAACPTFQYITDSVQTDVFVLFFSSMGLWALLRWQTTGRIGPLFVSALWIGYAIGVKPLGLYTLVAAAAMMALLCVTKDASGRRRWRHGLLYLVLLAILPGYTVGNFVRTGNPIYPHAGSLFPSWKWPPSSKLSQPSSTDSASDNWLARKSAINEKVEAEFAAQWRVTARFGSRPLDWALLPWRVTVSDEEPNQWGNAVLPSFLMMAPLLLLARWRDRVALLVFCAVYFAVWSTQPQHVRYGMTGFAALSALLAALLEGRLSRPLRLGATWLMVLIPAGFVTLYQVYDFSVANKLRYLAHRESRQDYLSRTDSQRRAYKAYQFLDSLQQSEGRPLRVQFFTCQGAEIRIDVRA